MAVATAGEQTLTAARVTRTGRRVAWALWGATAVLIAIYLAGLTASWWWHQPPDSVDPTRALASPGGAHPLGTDDLGRDVLARVLQGGVVSIEAGLATAALAGVCGALFGIAAGLRPGLVDTVIMRVVDCLLAFPPLVLAIAVTAGIGAGLFTACVGIGLSCVPYVVRIIRAEVLRIRSQGHVESSRALGVRPSLIMVRHVMPHVTSALLVQCASAASFTVVTLAGLGFIGLGAQPPQAEWGAMITEGFAPLVAGQWWLSVFPGVALLTVTAAIGVITDQLRVRLAGAGPASGGLR